MLPRGATHLYSFNLSWPLAERRALAARLNAYPSWRFLLSSFTAKTWAALGLRGAVDLETLTGLGMVGSGRRYAMHLVARDAPAPA